MRSERDPHAALSGRRAASFWLPASSRGAVCCPVGLSLAGTDTTLGKKIDANTRNFDLKKDGKVVGHVHRVVSADGKTLTVHNTGMQVSGTVGDETLVFDKQ
jgi:hypothetical protein